MFLADAINRIFAQIHSEHFRYQIFILLVIFFILPIMVTSYRRLKNFDHVKRKRESTPREFGLKLFHLVASIVTETLAGETGKIEKFDKDNCDSKKVFSELCIDYLFMVFMSLEGLVGDKDLEQHIFEFTKNYYYPYLIGQMDFVLSDMDLEKQKLNERFDEYKIYVNGDPKLWLLPLAKKMVENFKKDYDGSGEEVNEVIFAITNVMNEVPILFYKFKYASS